MSQIFDLKRYFGNKPAAQQNGQAQMQPVPMQGMPQAPMQNGYYQQPMGQLPVWGQPIPQGYQQGPFPMDPNMMSMQDPYMMGQMQMQPQSPAPPGPSPLLDGPPMDPSKREDVSLLTHFSQRLNVAITQAAAFATETKLPFIEPEHLLYGLLYDSGVFKVLQDQGVSATELQEEIKKEVKAGNSQTTPQFSQNVKTILENSVKDAKNRNEDFITPEHVLIAIVTTGNSLASEILAKKNITKATLDKKLTSDQPLAKSEKGSALEEFGYDITAKAKQGLLDPIVARDKEIERTMHILSRRTKNNPILVGEPGVGKTAIVEGLAQKIVSGNVPLDLRNKRIIAIDLTSLVAGASHRGEFEERLKRVIKEVQLAQGAIILFIDEIHTLVGAGGGEGSLNASNILKPFLARGEMQLIGTTTIEEYRRYIEKDPAFERRFQQVIVDEPDIEGATAMLKVIRKKYEEFHKVKIPDDVLEYAVKLSKRYIGDRFLPDKAIDLIDEAGSKIRLNAQDAQEPVVTKTDVEQIVADWTGIPVTRLTESETERLLSLEKLIHERLIDQEGAVAAIAEAVRRGRSGLKSANRPTGSFLFLGPTGTGKTELAKTLAEVLFGSDSLMIRIDMSEYMEKHEVAKLIGAPPGYVGYEEGGQLTEAVRTKPYSVVLLDEIEKAHPDVFNILLQILDDGRLTDNKGRTISFKNVILIATSNAGTALIQKEDLASAGGEQVIHMGNKRYSDKPPTKFEELAQKLIAELMKFFKPEILNRFDEIIVFKPLTQEHMIQIASINIKSTQKLLKEQNIGIEVSQAALKKLAEIGFDPVFGARPLRRTIQTQIENPISTQLIKKQYQEGDIIVVDYDGQKDEFTFQKRQSVPTQSGRTPDQASQAKPPQVPPQPGYPQSPILQQPTAQVTPPQSTQQPNPFTTMVQQTPAPTSMAQQTTGASPYNLYAKINQPIYNQNALNSNLQPQ